jgi:hypothetical protein
MVLMVLTAPGVQKVPTVPKVSKATLDQLALTVQKVLKVSKGRPVT